MAPSNSGVATFTYPQHTLICCRERSVLTLTLYGSGKQNHRRTTASPPFGNAIQRSA